jgi:hypothetical protein
LGSDWGLKRRERGACDEGRLVEGSRRSPAHEVEDKQGNSGTGYTTSVLLDGLKATMLGPEKKAWKEKEEKEKNRF